MAEIFENLEDVLTDWKQDDMGESLVQAVSLYEKEEEPKKRFFVQDNLEKSQSIATKRNTKWVVKLFH